jgi:hypothetical protein
MKKIIFLHHSTGRCIWLGETNQYFNKLGKKGPVERYFDDYNKKKHTEYHITSHIFPQKEPYGWKNYPYDYYNIWVKNAGREKYMDEPTLELLAPEYDVIVFKHCFPVCRIQKDTGVPDINSEERRLENYKLQYRSIRDKMYSFPDTRFIVWTPPALLEGKMTEDEAKRTLEFRRWILDEWDKKNDNIHVWDFYEYETEGGLYLQEKNASGPGDSHPGKSFSERVAPEFSQFIVDVIES